MRNRGKTSTRLVSRLRGSRPTFPPSADNRPPFFLDLGMDLGTGAITLTARSSAAARAALRALLGVARLLVERRDRLRQLVLHAGGVRPPPADGAHPPSAQAPQHRQRARVTELLELDHPFFLVLALSRLAQLEHVEGDTVHALFLIEVDEGGGGPAAARQVAPLVRHLGQEIGRRIADV